MNASDIPAAPTLDLSSRQARRIALSAIGLARPRPSRPGPAALAAMIDRLAMVQIDSVSVLARAHFMPGFSRLGAYDTALLDKASRGTKRRLFEYWGHEASLIDVAHHPDLRWRMARARAGKGIYAGLARFGAEKRPFIDAVLSEIETRGALTSRELALDGKGRQWRLVGLERWQARARMAVLGRAVTTPRARLRALYDLPERVLPGDPRCAPTPSDDEAQRQLSWPPRVRSASRPSPICAIISADRPGGGEDACRRTGRGRRAAAARVEGWRQQAFWRPAAGCRSVRPALCLAVRPPVLGARRAERLFGFRYRIEIYTPAAQASARLLRAALPVETTGSRPSSTSRRSAPRAGSWSRRLISKSPTRRAPSSRRSLPKCASSRFGSAFRRSSWLRAGISARRSPTRSRGAFPKKGRP